MAQQIIGLLGTTKVWSGELVNGVATITSSIFKVESVSGYFSAWIQAISAGGTPDLKVFYEMSYDDDIAHFAAPVGFPDIVTNLTLETIQIFAFSPPYLPYIRFKITGNATNPADTRVTMQLCVQ